MSEMTPLLLGALALFLVVLLVWLRLGSKPSSPSSVAIDFETYKWREESQRKFSSWGR